VFSSLLLEISQHIINIRFQITTANTDKVQVADAAAWYLREAAA
jgi:hypothetical protein